METWCSLAAFPSNKPIRKATAKRIRPERSNNQREVRTEGAQKVSEIQGLAEKDGTPNESVLTSTAQFPHRKHTKAKAKGLPSRDRRGDEPEEPACPCSEEGSNRRSPWSHRCPSTSFTATKTTTTVKPQQRQQRYPTAPKTRKNNSQQRDQIRGSKSRRASQIQKHPARRAWNLVDDKEKQQQHSKHHRELARERDEIAALVRDLTSFRRK